MSNRSILAIIPARGGSKGVPGKNIIDVCGKPLICYSINTGKRLVDMGTVGRCIVSTDSDEIAGVARNCGGDVPFLRPAELATDTAKSTEYIYHALDILDPTGEQYSVVMLLQPTAPLRDCDAIASAVESFMSSTADSLISCYQEDYINDLVMYKAGDGERLLPLNKNHNKGVRRQEHGSTYVRNGAVYLTRVNYLRNTDQIVCDQPMLMTMRKIDSIDLDNFDDLELLRAVMCK